MMRKTRRNWFLAMAAVFLVAWAGDSPAQPAGSWVGEIRRQGGRMPLRVHFGTEEGSASLDFPELGMSRLSAPAVISPDNRLTLMFPFGIGDVELEEVNGALAGSAGRFEVELRIDQQPRPEEVPITFRSGDLRLAGSLFLPATSGPHPAVVVVPGGAGVSRASNRAYYGWGDLLSRWGFAVLLYDKRGCGESEGEWRSASFDALAGDAVAAVDFLRARDDILANHVSLLGRSQAGWIIPMVATQTQVASLVLIAAPAVDPATAELQVIEHEFRDDGYSEAVIKDALTHMRLYFYVVRTGRGFEELVHSSKAVNEQPWGDFVYRVEKPEELRWWRLVDNHDPRKYLRGGLPPTLALYGGHDLVIPPIENAEKLRRLLAEGGTPVTLRVYPEGDHRIEIPSRELEDETFRFPRLAPGMLRDVEKFLHENGGPAPH